MGSNPRQPFGWLAWTLFEPISKGVGIFMSQFLTIRLIEIFFIKLNSSQLGRLSQQYVDQ